MVIADEGELSDAVTLLLPPFSLMEDELRLRVTVGAASPPAMASAWLGGSPTPLPPAASLPPLAPSSPLTPLPPLPAKAPATTAVTVIATMATATPSMTFHRSPGLRLRRLAGGGGAGWGVRSVCRYELPAVAEAGGPIGVGGEAVVDGTGALGGMSCRTVSRSGTFSTGRAQYSSRRSDSFATALSWDLFSRLKRSDCPGSA